MLPCQIDATLLSLDTTVTRCDVAGDGRWSVVLDQTPFYPEGGGQPADHGRIGAAQVLDVQAVAGAVVHTTDAPVSGPVVAAVDATRRRDHMQQHSAQHLLTAVIEDALGVSTVGFHLGETTTTIDLTRMLSTAEVAAMEAATNAHIRGARAVRPRVVSRAEYDAMAVRSRGLPDGLQGDVRLVDIEGLDLNTCGGTHVSSTAELQAVSVVKNERHKGGSRLHFLAGDRLLTRLHDALAREDALSRLLTAGPEAHAEVVDKLGLELADLIGAQLAAAVAPVAHVHRPEADLGLLKRIVDVALTGGGDRVVLATGGDGSGVFLLAGPAHRVDAAGPAVAAALAGRGGGRGGRFQGKAADLSGVPAALAAISGA